MNPVNDAPVLSAIEDQSIDEDAELSLTLSASDVDGDDLEYYVVVVGDASYTIVNNILTITPDLNTYGDVAITVAVTDDEYTATQNFTLTVLSLIHI